MRDASNLIYCNEEVRIFYGSQVTCGVGTILYIQKMKAERNKKHVIGLFKYQFIYSHELIITNYIVNRIIRLGNK